MTALIVYLLIGLSVTAVKLVRVVLMAPTTDFYTHVEKDPKRRRAQLRALGINVFASAVGRGAIWPLSLLTDYLMLRELSRHETSLHFKPLPSLMDVSRAEHQRNQDYVCRMLADLPSPPDGPIQPGSAAIMYLGLSAYFAHQADRVQGLKSADGRRRFVEYCTHTYEAMRESVDELAAAADAVEAFARSLEC